MPRSFSSLPALTPRLRSTHCLQTRSLQSKANFFDVQRVLSNNSPKESMPFHRDVGDLRAPSIRKAEIKGLKVRPGAPGGAFSKPGGGIVRSGLTKLLGPTVVNKLGVNALPLMRSIIPKTRQKGQYRPGMRSNNGFGERASGSAQDEAGSSRMAQKIFGIERRSVQHSPKANIRMFLVSMGLFATITGLTVVVAANFGVTDVVGHVNRLNSEVEREVQMLREMERGKRF